MKRPIVCYTNVKAANTALAAIQASSVEAELGETKGGDGSPIYSLSVEESHESQAVALVEDANLAEHAVRCPACNSINVEYPAMPQASPTMKAAEQVIDAIAGNRHDYMCRGCNHQWN